MLKNYTCHGVADKRRRKEINYVSKMQDYSNQKNG